MEGNNAHRARTNNRIEVEQDVNIGQDNRVLKAKEVAQKIKSFDHFAYLWGVKAGYYLPPKRSLTWRFVAQVLSGQKRLLKVSEVGYPIEMPKFKGQHVDNIWQQFKDTNQLHSYLPDVTGNAPIPRTYFYNVI